MCFMSAFKPLYRLLLVQRSVMPTTSALVHPILMSACRVGERHEWPGQGHQDSVKDMRVRASGNGQCQCSLALSYIQC
jgi:hypothetical protein